ncbi:hypothetical protein GCM10025857_33870 [Alicyclobacillus contaminans]|uniref:hypothetical protein n=1 Tax=Alicyclobacillus contaminans TaxID=392016 RepID=UPI0004261AFE|nr:hypothetical protein [Alicyclobacillus contaminans]GMA52030.1 hypothetical protein GCM10025857_33870 [Alicyclobacillus contaminans]
MDKQLVNDIAKECVAHGGNMAAKLHRALQLQMAMRQEGIDFPTLADAFAILASWEGHRVTVDSMTWVPPLMQDGETT